MEPELSSFEQFFSERIKEKGISLKKLSDATGIAPSHIESLLRGDFENMPSAPYFRGYLIRLGEELGFDGEEWWRRLKRDGAVKNSGAADTLPRNRFLKEAPPRYLWVIGVVALIALYAIFQAPRILGKPVLTVTAPDTNPYTTTANTFTLSGTVTNADALYLNDTQQIPIGPNGTWQEPVLLGAGPNPFKITAKKFLGGSTEVTEEILYNPGNAPANPAGSPSSTPSSTSSTTVSTTASTTPGR